MPDAINYTEARNKLAATMDRVCDTHEPVIITRQKAKPVVMLSLEEYNSIMETVHLMRHRNNAERLIESMRQAEAGTVEPRELIEE